MILTVSVILDTTTGELKVEHKDIRQPDQILMALNAGLELMRRKLQAAEVMELIQLERASRMAGGVNAGGRIIPGR